MNCTGNQLVVIVRAGDVASNCIGKIVRITSLHHIFPDAWRYEGLRLRWNTGLEIDALEDFCLRPIRPDESPEESTEAMRKLHELPQEVSA